MIMKRLGRKSATDVKKKQNKTHKLKGERLEKEKYMTKMIFFSAWFQVRVAESFETDMAMKNSSKFKEYERRFCYVVSFFTSMIS